MMCPALPSPLSRDALGIAKGHSLLQHAVRDGQHLVRYGHDGPFLPAPAAISAESAPGIRIPAFESPPTRTPPTRCAARSSRVSSDLLFGCPRSLDFPDRVGGPLFWRVYKRALSRIITEHTIEGVLSALALGLDCAGRSEERRVGKECRCRWAKKVEKEK